MKSFKRLFGKNLSGYTEKDNMGSLIESVESANGYWTFRNQSMTFDPFVLYEFKDDKTARKALLSLACIHEADDTGKLICTEMLYYGYYRTRKGAYEAFLCGEDLSCELWSQARDAFSRNGGTRKSDKEPARGPEPKTEKGSREATEVTYVGEETHERMGQTMIYHVYKGQDEISAKEFLKNNPVKEMYHYIIVETPDGNWGRDISGIFKE